MQVIVGVGDSDKGIVKRTPREELRLRVRLLRGRHVGDAFDRVKAELGEDRAHLLGPIDLSRNPLLKYVNRTAKAHLRPPLVDDLPEDLAMLIGDSSSRTVVGTYATVEGRPMPTVMREECRETLRYRIGCNFGGTLLGYATSTQRPTLLALMPDDLEVEYHSDDPNRPTTIRHLRRRKMGDGKVREVADVYDLVDLGAPSFTIWDGEEEVTQEALTAEEYASLQANGGWDPWWRYADGRPYHRIVIQGDPREVYRNLEIAEGTLGAIAIYTDCRAGVRDAGFPQRHAVGLSLKSKASNAQQRATGHPSGPEYIAQWRHDDPERPGFFHQDQPGYDPEVNMKAARMWEAGLLDTLGFPVDFESTGGEPLAREQEALDAAITATYDEARRHDGVVFKRLAAMTNRATAWLAEAGEEVEVTAFPEEVLSVLYNQEVTEALTPAAATDEVDFNELTLAIERLGKVGDLATINQIRRTLASSLGAQPPADLTAEDLAKTAAGPPPPPADGE